MLRAWLELPAVPAAAKKLGEGGHDEQRNKTLVYGCLTSDMLLCLTARYSMFKRSHARRARIVYIAIEYRQPIYAYNTHCPDSSNAVGGKRLLETNEEICKRKKSMI